MHRLTALRNNSTFLRFPIHIVPNQSSALSVYSDKYQVNAQNTYQIMTLIISDMGNFQITSCTGKRQHHLQSRGGVCKLPI